MESGTATCGFQLPGASITTKSLAERVSGVAAASVVTSTVPGFSRSRIASITSGVPWMRSSSAVVAFRAPFLLVG